MSMRYLIRAKKIVTVTPNGTVQDGVICIEKGRIKWISEWKDIQENWTSSLSNTEIIHYEDGVITPSLVDCHTHLLEFAPFSLYPVTAETHLMQAVHLLFQALSAGITAVGEQICGHPQAHMSIDRYRDLVRNLPLDVQFSVSAVSIGFDPLRHFTGVTGSKPVELEQLTADQSLIERLARESDFPGENVFINATPANFPEERVPLAGEIIYSVDQLKRIAEQFKQQEKKFGAHVGGAEGIERALQAGVDVLHHAHGITAGQIQEAANRGCWIVATPLGGTHHIPHSPEEVHRLIEHGITVALATDSYIPPHPEASWFPLQTTALQGPQVFMTMAHPFMRFLQERGWDENDVLSLITLNGARVLGKDDQYGCLREGMEANFIVSSGIPGLEITRIEDIQHVYYRGKKVVQRG